MQVLGLGGVMACSLPLDAGGLLYYDSVHSVWLYEADAVQARLHGLKDVRSRDHCSYTIVTSQCFAVPLPLPRTTVPLWRRGSRWFGFISILTHGARESGVYISTVE